MDLQPRVVEEGGPPYQDPEGWPNPRAGYLEATSSPVQGWWCARCGALVKRGSAGRHDEFHATLNGA
jgi:hypothetical protein